MCFNLIEIDNYNKLQHSMWYGITFLAALDMMILDDRVVILDSRRIMYYCI